ncbi:MAG: glycosyltransferase family 39 protein [Acidobacteriota bacterium]
MVKVAEMGRTGGGGEVSRWLAAGAWGALVVLWLLDAKLDLPAGLPRTVAGLAAGASLWAVWRHPTLLRKPGRWLPLALLGLSLVVRFTGIEYEISGHYYADEGTYYKQSTLINEGRLLSPSFNYGHFLYWAGAFALWLAELFSGLSASLIGLWGVTEPIDRAWWVLRSVVALASALTVLPVYALATRLGGRFGGLAASLLLIFSPLFNQLSHLILCDTVSAFFATLCAACVGRLVDVENRRDYLLAGAASGLAAASKYPAGVVAVAIIAVWLLHRLTSRRWNAGLLWAGAASLGSFLVVMVAMFKHPEAAFLSRRGIFFGVRQYAGGGWLGVQPQSNLAWYGNELWVTFGIGALLLGLSGFLWHRRDTLRRVAWNLVFPLTFLWLMVAMTMVVKRNLLPVLPVLAVLLGVGLAGWWRCFGSERPGGSAKRSWLAALLLVAALALPWWTTAQQAVGLASPSNREWTMAWIVDHLPPGARFVKESYTPRLPPDFPYSNSRFAGRFSLDQIRHPQNDFLLLSSAAYRRFLAPENLTKEHHRVFAQRYRQIFDEMTPLKDFHPSPTRRGPVLRLYALDPPDPRLERRRPFRAAEGFCADGARVAEQRAVYEATGGWCLFKGYFEPGEYRLEWVGSEVAAAAAQVDVRMREGEKVGWSPLPGRIRLPQPGKVFFYVRLPPGAQLESFGVVGVAAEDPPASLPRNDR